MYNTINNTILYGGKVLSNINKTILILTAQFGAGHVSAANAIKEYILDKNKDYNVVIQNFINASIPRINNPMVKMYEKNTKYVPELYNYYYYAKKNFDSKFDISYKIYTPKLTEYILQIKPDLIISTFPSAAGCVHDFNSKAENKRIPTITVVTDVVDSLEWIFPNTDMYFVPTYEIKNRYVQKGLNPDLFRITGVPTNKKFNLIDKTQRKDGRYNILLMGGGRGLFDFDEDFIRWADKFSFENKDKIHLTIVTGKNKKLYNNLKFKNPLINIEVLGFVKDMPSLIKKYDLLVTKPGGATLFEAIQSQIPIIVKTPKVGQEIENSKFIIDKGIGIVYSNQAELQEIFDSIVNNDLDARIKFMQNNLIHVKKNIHPNKIGDYVMELL